jgi:hypothetical protein
MLTKSGKPFEPCVAMCEVQGKTVLVSCDPEEVDLDNVKITSKELAIRAFRAYNLSYGHNFAFCADEVKLISVLDKNERQWS